MRRLMFLLCLAAASGWADDLRCVDFTAPGGVKCRLTAEGSQIWRLRTADADGRFAEVGAVQALARWMGETMPVSPQPIRAATANGIRTFTSSDGSKAVLAADGSTLAFFSAIGGASRMGVLVKGGNFAEQLAKARAIAFDKTGTVTEGKPRVHEIIPGEGFTAEQTAQMAAAAEINSVHPYAQAIREYAGAVENITEYKNYCELAGHGVLCEDSDGRQILCGGGKLMRKYGIEIPEGKSAQAYVACEGRLAGRIFISDSSKAGVKDTVAELKALGVDELTLLTGDGYDSARLVAESVGIENFRAELLPENKVEEIGKMKSRGLVTAFVGDGINDAPVLASADVGIAMGLGSGAAIEAADMVLSSDNLSALPGAIRHFRQAMGVIRFNIAFALAVKAAVLIAAAFGYAPMWAAVFADVGVCLICVANASRLIQPKK